MYTSICTHLSFHSVQHSRRPAGEGNTWDEGRNVARVSTSYMLSDGRNAPMSRWAYCTQRYRPFSCIFKVPFPSYIQGSRRRECCYISTSFTTWTCSHLAHLPHSRWHHEHCFRQWIFHISKFCEGLQKALLHLSFWVQELVSFQVFIFFSQK